jgi:hypothetical protein
MKADGNGECVKFIRMKALGELAVYQWFCFGRAWVTLGVR